jgi:hypothetical protein
VIRSARLPAGRLGPVTTAPAGRTLGRPAVAGSRLLYHRTTAGGAIVRLLDLAGGRPRTLRRERRAMLLNPSARGSRLIYVRSTYRRQELLYGRLRRRSTFRDRVLYSTVPTGRRDAEHEPGYRRDEHTPGGLYPRPPTGRSDTLWTTALGPHGAFVTRLRQRTGRPVRAVLFRVPR